MTGYPEQLDELRRTGRYSVTPPPLTQKARKPMPVPEFKPALVRAETAKDNRRAANRRCALEAAVSSSHLDASVDQIINTAARLAAWLEETDAQAEAPIAPTEVSDDREWVVHCAAEVTRTNEDPFTGSVAVWYRAEYTFPGYAPNKSVTVLNVPPGKRTYVGLRLRWKPHAEGRLVQLADLSTTPATVFASKLIRPL